MPVHVVGVEREKAVDVGVDPTRPGRGAMPLRTIARCLRGIAVQVVVDLRQDRLAERHIEVLPRPAGFAHGAVAQLEVLDAEPCTELLGRMPCSAATRLGLHGCHATIGAERQRDQRVPEEEALHFGQRQHSDNLRIALGEQDNAC